VDSVVRRAGRDKIANNVPGDLSQEDPNNGAEENAAGMEEGEPGAVRGEMRCRLWIWKWTSRTAMQDGHRALQS
jgi:hypothetical protein